ncbi:MAG: DUF6928 family protein [Gammaproteobacteria bacterium]
MGLSAGAIYLAECSQVHDAAQSLGLFNDSMKKLETAAQGFPSPAELYLSSYNDWGVILTEPQGLIDLVHEYHKELIKLSNVRKIFIWATQSVEGAVLFELVEDGHLKRRWYESGGIIIEQIGAALIEESNIIENDRDESGPYHDEWSMLKLTSNIVGISEDDHFTLQSTGYDVSVIREPQPRANWISRLFRRS